MKNRNTSGLKKHLLSMYKKESEKLYLKKTSKLIACNFFGASTSEQVCTKLYLIIPNKYTNYKQVYNKIKIITIFHSSYIFVNNSKLFIQK